MPHNEKLWALAPDSASLVLRDLALGMSPPKGAAPPAAAALPQKAEGATGYRLAGDVAVIDITGTITRQAVYSAWSGRPISQGQDTILAALNAAAADKRVKAVLLNINSPGGVVSGTKELADRIAEVARHKPMAAYANGLMASAALWLGAVTGRVLAPLTATVGSIGVIWVHADWSKFYEDFGVSISYVTAGKWKAAGNDAAPLSDDERAYFERQLSQIHEIFKADASRGLGITAPAASWAEGQTMLAAEAQKLGLVSQIVRDLDSAITLLSREATMDKATLAAAHPELLAQITAEASAEAQKEMQAKADEAAHAATQNALGMFKAVAGAEAAQKVEELLASGLTPEQLAAAQKALGAPATGAKENTGEAAAQAAILAGLEKSAAQPVNTGASVTHKHKSSLVADAERRAAQAAQQGVF